MSGRPIKKSICAQRVVGSAMPKMKYNVDEKKIPAEESGGLAEKEMKPDSKAKSDAQQRMKDGMQGGMRDRQKVSLLNILKVMATYASQMIVFAFITVLILGYKKS